MTFCHYCKDKDNLLAEASINLVNTECDEECEKILRRETDLEEIKHQSLVATCDWVAKHYKQIQNIIYRGETLPLEIFKNALFGNDSRFMSEAILPAPLPLKPLLFEVFTKM